MSDDLEKQARELRDAMCGSGDLCRNDAGCGCLDRLLAFARAIAAERDDEMGKLQAQCVAALWLIPGDSTLGQLQDAHDKAKALIAERDKLKDELEKAKFSCTALVNGNEQLYRSVKEALAQRECLRTEYEAEIERLRAKPPTDALIADRDVLKNALDECRALLNAAEAERDKLKAEVERLKNSEEAWKIVAKKNKTWAELPQTEKEAALSKGLDDEIRSHMATTAERDSLRADLDRAREANAKLAAVLDGAGQQFRHYEQLHLAKPDVAKAAANALMAIQCENALRDTRLALQKAAALHEPTGEKAT